jgi:hypothetical protein
MNCTLCNQPIKNYDARFHHLQIDSSHSADICTECIDKFTKWQGSVISNLFPTKALKKRYEKDR